MHFSVVYYENIDPRENYTCGVTSKMTFITQLAFRKTDGSKNVAHKKIQVSKIILI